MLSVDPTTILEDTYTSGVPATVFRLLTDMQSTAGSTQVKILITITFLVQSWWWSKKGRQLRLGAIYSCRRLVGFKISEAV